jgi:glycosyltransferase involved in cell wall biosynthesis
MTLSVVIPAFNEEAILDRTLEAVHATTAGASCEVIVVDNESTDRTAEIAARSGARVITEPVHNIARVRNTGAAAAGGDVLVFLDADTLVSRDLLAAIANVLRDENTIGGAVAVEYTEFRRWWMKGYVAGWRFWSRYFDMKQGAAQFCRTDVFQRLGGYDESIYMGEDIEFYWRMARHAKRTGARVHFLEKPRVLTSSRRFDRMGLWKTLLFTHPIFIRLGWKRKSFWRDWYDEPVR